MRDLRTFLLQQCEERDLSLRQASLRAGLDHSAVSRFVNGTRPTRESSAKLARFFGVPEGYVLLLAGHVIRPESFTPQSDLEWELLDKFRTLSAERRRGRGHHYVRREILHRQLAERLQEIAATPGHIEALLERLPTGEEEKQELHRLRTALLAHQDDLLRRRRRWSDAYEAGLTDLAGYGERIRDLERQEESADGQLECIEAQLRQSQEREDYAAHLQEALATLPELLTGELTEEASQILRAAFSNHLAKVYIQDRIIIRVDFRLP